MRCRKARSLLSTYCSDELVGRQQVQMREHLAGCESCRKEAALYTSISESTNELPKMTLSDDFNAKLLNRVAAERFSETRTKAYLPRRAPVLSWRLVAPALASAALVVFVAISMLIPQQHGVQPGTYAESQSSNDPHMTVQPGSNPNMTVHAQNDMSLEQQLSRAERFSQLSKMLTDNQGFGNLHLTSTMNTGRIANRPTVPYGNTFFRVQPVIKVYQRAVATDKEEGDKAY